MMHDRTTDAGPRLRLAGPDHIGKVVMIRSSLLLLVAVLTCCTRASLSQRAQGAEILPDSPIEVAARVTVLLLRAGTGAPLVRDRVIIAPDSSVVSDAQAVRALASMPGSRCTAEPNGDALRISCTRLDERELALERDLAALLGGYLGKSGRERLRNEPFEYVLVRGAGEEALLSLEQLDAAAMNYFIVIDGFSVGGLAPSDEQRRAGVGWILKVENIGGSAEEAGYPTATSCNIRGIAHGLPQARVQTEV